MINFIYYEELKMIWGFKGQGNKVILETEKDYIDYAKKKLNIKNSKKSNEVLKKYYKRYMGE